VRPETQKIVAELEERSGLPVQVVPMKDLPVMSRVTMSPQATGSYLVQYRPGITFADYAIAFQCGHVLRLLALPASERRQFVASDSAMSWGTTLVKRHLASSPASPPADDVVGAFTAKLVSGLLTQLRSIPIGMRIDAWLAEHAPGLADQQAAAFALQQQEALVSLTADIRKIVPDEIVAGSILLNTAYALFCDRLLENSSYAVPYEAAGFKELGGALLALFDATPDGPEYDCDLVDRWAAEIGLTGKYQWAPLTTPVPVVS
jgi:hypothetical protein